MAENNGDVQARDDGEVLANEPVAIRLAGMEFDFCEPPRRRARGLVRGLLDIFTKYPYLQDSESLGEIDVLKNPDVGSQMLRSVDDLLDFLYMAIPNAGQKRTYIDDHADMEEIVEAFGVVSEVIMRPFLSAPEPEK